MLVGSSAVYVAVACAKGISSQSGTGGDGGGNGGPGTSGGISIGPDEAQAAESGTRLKARRYVSTDGAKQPTGMWFDTTRNEECSFATAADGKLRCLPRMMPTVELFADAGCIQRLAMTQAGCPAPEYISIGVGAAGCSTQGMRVLAKGAQFTGASVYAKSGGACNAISVATSYPTYSFFGLGADINASEFAEAAIQTDP